MSDPAKGDSSDFPDVATEVGRRYWIRLATDNLSGTHALMMHDDMRRLMRMHSSVPLRLRAKADALEIGVELDEEAHNKHLQGTPLDEILLPGFRSLLDRVVAMEPLDETLMFEVLLCRGVDNFLTYIAEMIATLFRKRPETLRSDETVTMKQVLAQPDLEAFIAWFADRKVSSLSYKGLGEVETFIRGRFGLALSEGDEQRIKLNEVIAVRNLIVHRRGVIDSRFIDSVGDSYGLIGDQIAARKFWSSRHVDVPSEVVRSFDRAAAAKFGVAVHPNPTPDFWSSGVESEV